MDRGKSLSNPKYGSPTFHFLNIYVSGECEIKCCSAVATNWSPTHLFDPLDHWLQPARVDLTVAIKEGKNRG